MSWALTYKSICDSTSCRSSAGTLVSFSASQIPTFMVQVQWCGSQKGGGSLLNTSVPRPQGWESHTQSELAAQIPPRSAYLHSHTQLQLSSSVVNPERVVNKTAQKWQRQQDFYVTIDTAARLGLLKQKSGHVTPKLKTLQRRATLPILLRIESHIPTLDSKV